MQISHLYIYPIKSLRGQSIPAAEATYQGFKYDRRFMLLRASDHKNMHVANFPEMCLFTTSLTPPSTSASSASPSGGSITVTYTPPTGPDAKEGMGAEPSVLEVPLLPEWKGLAMVDVSMHSSPTKGYDMGGRYNEWFSKCFGYGVVLAYIGGSRREILGNVSPGAAAAAAQQQQQQNGGWGGWLGSMKAMMGLDQDGSGAGAGVEEGIAFSDCAPYLFVSEKSWMNADARLPEGETMDITKFRPNVVVSGDELEAFEEDYWAELAVGGEEGGVRVVLTQNCARCSSLNVDYRTGKVGKGGAGSILKKLQSDRRVDLGAKYSPIFGRYGFLDKMPTGTKLSVGDEVRVLRRNGERTRFVWPNLSTDK